MSVSIIILLTVDSLFSWFAGVPTTDLKAVAIAWKFNELDRNHDLVLGRKEYRDIRHTVRKNIKPRLCAREFPLLCDVNANRRVSFLEWTDCWSEKS